MGGGSGEKEKKKKKGKGARRPSPRPPSACSKTGPPDQGTPNKQRGLSEGAGALGIGRVLSLAAAEVQARRRRGGAPGAPGAAAVLAKDFLEKMAAARLRERRRGEGAVHLAVRTGCPLLVEAALRAAPGAGAVDERCFNNWTPLHLAAALGHGEVVAALVAAGAATEARGGASGRWTAVALLAGSFPP